MQGLARRLFVAVATAAPFVVFPLSAMAVAGGATGGGGSSSSGSSGGSSSSSSGSSSSGSDSSGDGSGEWWVPIAFIGVIFLFALGLKLWIRFHPEASDAEEPDRERDVAAAARSANASDGYWDPAVLEERVRECFFPIQLSWENRDIEGSRPFVSDALYERHRLQLEGYEQQHRMNRIEDLELRDLRLVRIHNVTADGEDRFVMHVVCSARDWMEDTRTGQLVNGDPNSPTEFSQYWSFGRDPRYGWVLDEIQQAEEGGYHEEAEVVNADTGPPAGTAPAPTAPAWNNGNGAQPRPAGSQPPNWYPDPHGTHRWRWWDGRGWTTHVAN